MSDPLLPAWINPFVKEVNGQYIHRSLWDKNWLTNPNDVTEDMRIVTREESYQIQKLSPAESTVYVYYFDNDNGIKIEDGEKTLSVSVTSTENIKSDPNRVIV